MSDDAQEQRGNSEKRVVGRPFQPGQSGNPGGRPKGSVSLTTVLREVLDEDPEVAKAMIRGGLTSAKEGNAAWAKLIFDRVDGPQTQKLEIDDMREKTIEEIDEEIAALEKLNADN